MPGVGTAIKVTGGLCGAGGLLWVMMVVGQKIAEANLPKVDPRVDGYSKCIGTFLSDMTTYVSCLDQHAGKKCLMDDNRMTTPEDSHNCLALITAIPSLTLNAQIIRTAHDVCYTYLRDVAECLGLAVQIDELEPCFRREVFARVGTIVDDCKNKSGIPKDADIGSGSGLGIGDAFGPNDKLKLIALQQANRTMHTSRRQTTWMGWQEGHAETLGVTPATEQSPTMAFDVHQGGVDVGAGSGF